MEADASQTDASRDAWLALMLTPGIGPVLAGRCVERFGTADAVLNASAGELAGVRGISSRGAERLRRDLDDARRSAVPREREAIAAAGAHLLHVDDPGYPSLLRLIPDPPPLLWVRGEIAEGDAVALALVGARKCTHYGREQADRFAAQLAEAGITVVSGGAYGIDLAAHRGALRLGGRTVAVLGSGLANVYPREHTPLFDEIVASRKGAVVSEHPMGAAPQAEHFPRRNRIISGMSLGTLVIEAARRSGALITARVCVEEHGRELMALPGRIDSRASEGCHQMIRDGWATLVTSVSDVLDQLGDVGRTIQTLRAGQEQRRPADAPPPAEPGLSDVQQRIIAVCDEPRSLDQIAAMTDLEIHAITPELTMLEIRGALTRRSGLFTRRR